MSRIVIYLLELLGLIGIVGMLAFIPWTKMALGGALAAIGAFFPRLQEEKDRPGKLTLKHKAIQVMLNGGPRFALVSAGIVVLLGALLDGHDGLAKKQEADRHRAAENSFRQIEKKLYVVDKSSGKAHTDAELKQLHRLLLAKLPRETAASTSPVPTPPADEPSKP